MRASRAPRSVLPLRAEQALEHRARVVLDRQRRRRRAPRRWCWCRRSSRRRRRSRASRSTRCRARATPSCVSFASSWRRSDPSTPSRSTSAPDGELERHAGQERAGRSRVVAAALDAVRRLVGEAAAQQHPILERGQRPQRRRQLAERPFGLREPVRHRHAVRHVEDAEPPHRRRRRLAMRGQRRHHAVEHGSASAAPKPRSTDRRDRCIFVMITSALLRCRSLARLVHVDAGRALSPPRDLRIWNGALDDAQDERRPAVVVVAQRRARAGERQGHPGSRGRGRARRSAASRSRSGRPRRRGRAAPRGTPSDCRLAPWNVDRRSRCGAPPSVSRQRPTASKCSSAKPSGSICAWQLAQTALFRCCSIRSRSAAGLPRGRSP